MDPGIYSCNHISYMQSPWHIWFQEMGYPELDIIRYEDGQWAIIQYHSSPVMPCLTKWQVVLGYMKNVEISYSFCEKYIKQIDMRLKAFWLREREESNIAINEHAALEKHAGEMSEHAYRAIRGNPDMMNRIARNGIQEMDLALLSKHVSRHEKYNTKFKGKTVATVRS